MFKIRNQMLGNNEMAHIQSGLLPALLPSVKKYSIRIQRGPVRQSFPEQRSVLGAFQGKSCLYDCANEII